MAKKYDEEFRRRALQMLSDGVPVSRAALELGVSVWTLRKWQVGIETAKSEGTEELMESEREELKRLRKENQQLRTERDILKKATAYFAKIAP